MLLGVALAAPGRGERQHTVPAKTNGATTANAATDPGAALAGSVK